MNYKLLKNVERGKNISNNVYKYRTPDMEIGVKKLMKIKRADHEKDGGRLCGMRNFENVLNIAKRFQK